MEIVVRRRTLPRLFVDVALPLWLFQGANDEEDVSSKLDDFLGKLDVFNVHFHYPSRPEYQVSKINSHQAFFWFSYPIFRRTQDYSRTPRKYVFDVTSVGQHSPPWTCSSVKVEVKFRLTCGLRFPCAQFMLRQMHWANLSVSFEAKYWLSLLSLDFIKRTCKRAMKSTLNSPFCAVTADSKSRWPHGRKACFRGVLFSRRHWLRHGGLHRIEGSLSADVLIHGRQPEVTISASQSRRMSWRIWQEVVDVRRACFPFVLFLEKIYNSEIVTSGSLNQKRLCLSSPKSLTTDFLPADFEIREPVHRAWSDDCSIGWGRLWKEYPHETPAENIRPANWEGRTVVCLYKLGR